MGCDSTASLVLCCPQDDPQGVGQRAEATEGTVTPLTAGQPRQMWLSAEASPSRYVLLLATAWEEGSVS